MSLRLKAVLLIIAVLAVTLGVLTLVANNVLQGGYSTIERQLLERNLRRVANEVNKQLTQLNHWANDYANWSATYTYLEGTNPTYPATEWTLAVQTNLRIDTVIIADLERNLVFDQSINPQGDALRPTLPDELAVADIQRFYQTVDEQKAVSGLILIDNKLALVTAKAVLTTEAEGPSVGTILMIKYADEELVQEMSRSLALDLALFLYDEAGPPYIRQAIQTYKEGVETPTELLNDATIQGYTILKGLDNQPLALAQVTEERSVTQQGRNTVVLFLVSIAIAGLVSALALSLFLDQSVFARLRNVNKQLAQIRNNTEVISLGVSGQDELSELVITVNEMLTRLRDSKTRADQQLGVATEAANELVRIQELLALLLNQTEDIARRSGSYGEIRDLVNYTRKQARL